MGIKSMRMQNAASCRMSEPTTLFSCWKAALRFLLNACKAAMAKFSGGKPKLYVSYMYTASQTGYSEEERSGIQLDQIRIGSFIADMRKAQGMTQRSLADLLCVSDKTISKWERGRGLPEVSLMLPLCDALGIGVNELLSGERIAESDYRRKAEENMMDLIKESEENRRHMVLSIICGIITVIAVCALIVIVSYIAMPIAARIAVLALAILTAVAGIGAAAALEIRAGFYECPNCGTEFVPTMADYIKGYHTVLKRRLRCPGCGRTGMCRHRITR